MISFLHDYKAEFSFDAAEKSRREQAIKEQILVLKIEVKAAKLLIMPFFS
jgi:hypothetical protein